MIQNRKSQQGITMMEILVTVIIMSVGILGMAQLQFTSLKNLSNSHFRYQASILAYDMSERMIANSGGVAAGSYNAISADGSETAVSCASSCGPGAIATLDTYEWGQNLKALPGGSGSVTASGNAFDVVVNWTEQHTGADVGSVTATPDSKSYTLTVEF